VGAVEYQQTLDQLLMHQFIKRKRAVDESIDGYPLRGVEAGDLGT
tara:strand:+ start:565 stop:699 length:135 start_codon:yes stop_codon:yes gene_type:complete